MFLVLKRDWPAIDFAIPRPDAVIPKNHPTITAGRHEVERIRNPHGFDCYILVLKGTLIGATEASWRQWAPGQLPDVPKEDPRYGKPIDWEELEVVIEE